VLQVKWKLVALNDLAEIIDYIEQRNAVAAKDLHSTIKKAAEGLSEAPYIFRYGRAPGTRECVVHPNYVMVYQVGADCIDVLRVLHARQEYPGT
jgi:addiction module RelE/StbE family toxin